jgi:hypothetical protein
VGARATGGLPGGGLGALAGATSSSESCRSAFAGPLTFPFAAAVFLVAAMVTKPSRYRPLPV